METQEAEITIEAPQPSEQDGVQAQETEESMAKILCPNCGVGPFKDARGLSSHRRVKHGIVGSSKSALALRKAQARIEPPKRRGRPPGKAMKAKPKSHHARKPAALPPNYAPAVVSQFAPSLLGYAAAKLESLAEKIAHENNLPEKEFAREVMSTFAALVQLP